MARRYSRREFLTDASFALSISILLNVFAPAQAAQAPTQTAKQSNSASTGD